MQLETIYLKDHYPFLGENGADPVLTVYVRDELPFKNYPNIKRPGIVLCPGGGYSSVSPREAEPIALQLLAMGCNVFMLKYSVAPHGFPHQLREVAAVMELIYQNSDSWNTDTGKIGILGFSAGGHLAGHYTNAYDFPEVRAVFPESKPVQASILCYPVIAVDPVHGHRGSFQRLTGLEDPFTPEVYEKFSCHRLVTDKTPPAFLWHTTTDTVVPVANSLLYAQALADHKIPFALHIYPYGPHGLSTVDAETNKKVNPEYAPAQAWLPELEKWLDIQFDIWGVKEDALV